jgi:hypothetical protein
MSKASLKSRREIEILSKYRREPMVTDMTKQTARDSPLFALPWLMNNQIDVDYHVKRGIVESKSPTFVSYKNMTSRDSKPSPKKKKKNSGEASSLDYSPNKDFVMERVKGVPNMKKTSSRDSHFLTKFTEYNNTLTSQVDYSEAKSTIIADENRKRVDSLVAKTPVIDWSKTGKKKTQIIHNPAVNLDYQVSYNAIDIQSKGDYSMDGQSERRPLFKYPWLSNLQPAPQRTQDKHYDVKYDVVEPHVNATPSIAKTTGRDLEKQHQVRNDLSYTPKYSQIDLSVPGKDIFLSTGRVNTVKAISKSVDNLISRVNEDIRRYGISPEKEKRSTTPMRRETRTAPSVSRQSNLENHFDKITHSMIASPAPQIGHRRSSVDSDN